MRRWFAFFALGGFLIGCSSAGASNGLGTGGYGGNIGQQGCTATPDCGACDGCYSQCVCSTGAKDQCVSACGLNPGAGGSGSGGTGAGGSGGTGAGGTGAGGSGTGGTGGSTTGGTGGSGGSTPVGNLAGGIRVTEISINQSVKIPIMQNGSAVSNRNAPVVQGRAALMRVFVTPDSGFQSRPIVARLSVAGAPDQTITLTVSGPSSDANLMSAYNFDVPADQMTGNMQFDVQLEEANGATSNGATDGARWPQSGTSALGAQVSGPFKVVAVPLIMNGITPDTSNAHMQALHDTLMAMYPTTDVQLDVRNPISSCPAVSASGGGWSSALNCVSGLRNSLGVDSKTFIYGMAAPSNSMQGYCGYGCVAGLGSVPQANDPYGRAAIGIAYFPDGSGGPSQYSGGATMTMAHELGHALGRNHSPCAPQGASLSGVDQSYPYQGASIGVWGWDMIAKQLKSPSQYTDVMGYCTPDWISDYTYRNIENRIAYVNANGYVIDNPDPARAPGLFRVAIIEPDGTMHWTDSRYFKYPQYGEKRDVQVLDASGNVTSTVVGFFNPVSDLAGGMLYVRESALSASVHAIKALSVSKTVLTLH